MNSQVIIALDFNNANDVEEFLSNFGDEKLFLKVGMELFYSEGVELIKLLKKRGHNIFLDLKLYDIPTTVSKAIDVLGNLGVDMLTIHLQGGDAMISAAQKAADKHQLKLLGVSVLTSQDINDLVKTNYTLPEVLNDLIAKADQHNLFGVVCSGADLTTIGNYQVKYVTPGIRLKSDDNNDQKRVMTPKAAIDAGSDFLVIGRSITQNSAPNVVYKQIIKEING